MRNATVAFDASAADAAVTLAPTKPSAKEATAIDALASGVAKGTAGLFGTKCRIMVASSPAGSSQILSVRSVSIGET